MSGRPARLQSVPDSLSPAVESSYPRRAVSVSAESESSAGRTVLARTRFWQHRIQTGETSDCKTDLNRYPQMPRESFKRYVKTINKGSSVSASAVVGLRVSTVFLDVA